MLQYMHCHVVNKETNRLNEMEVISVNDEQPAALKNQRGLIKFHEDEAFVVIYLITAVVTGLRYVFCFTDKPYVFNVKFSQNQSHFN